MTKLKVSGMTCAHCVRAVTGAVKTVQPDSDVQVDLATGMVTISGSVAPDALQRIETAIKAEGYEAFLP